MGNPKRLREYLEQGDGCCNCDDYSIEGDLLSRMGCLSPRKFGARACGAEWTSVFKLVSIRDFKIEDTENGNGQD